jgi:hypothetical protein
MEQSFFSRYRDNEESTLGAPLRQFVGDPALLSLPAREELCYRYQYLEESIPTLASDYRVTPKALQDFFLENDIHPQELSTPDQIAAFETRVNETYKSIRIRMSGLVALQTARAWEKLAISEDYLLASLAKASELIHEKANNQFVDARELKQLIDAHAKVVDRQQLIREAIKVPAAIDIEGLANTLQKSLEQLLEEIDGDAKKLPKEQENVIL